MHARHNLFKSDTVTRQPKAGSGKDGTSTPHFAPLKSPPFLACAVFVDITHSLILAAQSPSRDKKIDTRYEDNVVSDQPRMLTLNQSTASFV